MIKDVRLQGDLITAMMEKQACSWNGHSKASSSNKCLNQTED